jgi:hypothetical protein
VYAGTASSLQAKVAQSQADIKKLLDSLQVSLAPLFSSSLPYHYTRVQNFSNRMEKQAALSSSAVADVAVPGTCKVSVLAPKAAKRIAFLSDLPDDVLLKCTDSLDVQSFLPISIPRLPCFHVFLLQHVMHPQAFLLRHPVVSAHLLKPASAYAPSHLQTTCGSHCLFKCGANCSLSHLRASSRLKPYTPALSISCLIHVPDVPHHIG